MTNSIAISHNILNLKNLKHQWMLDDSLVCTSYNSWIQILNKYQNQEFLSFIGVKTKIEHKLVIYSEKTVVNTFLNEKAFLQLRGYINMWNTHIFKITTQIIKPTNWFHKELKNPKHYLSFQGT